MTKEGLKQKCEERAKIFQQAMESCHSSSPIDCIEWFADRIAELEVQIEKMKCCSICKHYSMSFIPYWCTKNSTAPHCTSKCDKWEIKENG